MPTHPCLRACKQPCPPTPARLLAVAGPSAAAAKQGRLGSSAGGSTTGDGRRIQEIKNEDDDDDDDDADDDDDDDDHDDDDDVLAAARRCASPRGSDLRAALDCILGRFRPSCEGCPHSLAGDSRKNQPHICLLP